MFRLLFNCLLNQINLIRQLGFAYISATSCALVTALGLKAVLSQVNPSCRIDN